MAPGQLLRTWVLPMDLRPLLVWVSGVLQLTCFHVDSVIQLPIIVLVMLVRSSRLMLILPRRLVHNQSKSQQMVPMRLNILAMDRWDHSVRRPEILHSHQPGSRVSQADRTTSKPISQILIPRLPVVQVINSMPPDSGNFS